MRNSEYVEALVGRLNVETGDGRIIRRLDTQGGAHIPVFGFTGPKKEKNLIGDATTEVTDEGIVATMRVTTGTAARLLAGQVRAHLDIKDAAVQVEAGQAVVNGGTIMALTVTDGAPAWSDLWVRPADPR